MNNRLPRGSDPLYLDLGMLNIGQMKDSPEIFYFQMKHAVIIFADSNTGDITIWNPWHYGTA